MGALRLPLKKKWFDITKIGIKTEDYREINEYWFKRLMYFDYENAGCQPERKTDLGKAIRKLSSGTLSVIKDMHIITRNFDSNIITWGYPKADDKERIVKLEHKGIEIRKGNSLWGAEKNKYYFVIKHGAIIN